MPARLSVIAVRHGSTDLTGVVLNGSGPNAADPDLNDGGWREVAALRSCLAERGLLDQLRLTVASTSLRATTTAQTLVGEGVATDSRLCEVSFGSWEGRSAQELCRTEQEDFSQWQRDPALAPPGGTSLVAVAQQVREWRSQLMSEVNDGDHARVLVVAHASTVRILAADALGLPLDRSQRLSVGTATAAIVNFWADGGSSLEALLPAQM